MKTNLLSVALLLSGTFLAHAQGIFVYDQQSSDESNFGSGGSGIQFNQPMGQSFTPTISSVGFIRLVLYDGIQENNVGASIRVDLRANSITGTVLGSSDLVLLPDNFGLGSNGVVNFFFSSPVPVSAGITYFFRPEVESGDDFGVAIYSTFNYAGGTVFGHGTANPFSDMWFREGIIVPEPASALLALLGGSGLVWLRRKKFTKPDRRV